MIFTSRLVGLTASSVAVALAAAAGAVALPADHQVPAPKRGTYSTPAKGQWSDATFKVVNKGGGLAVVGFSWTVTKKEAAASDGFCAAGAFSVPAALPIRLHRTTGAHHQMIWAVAKKQKDFQGGVGPINVAVTTPSGSEPRTLYINFTKAKHLTSGQLAYEPDGVLYNKGGTCNYQFTVHPS